MTSRPPLLLGYPSRSSSPSPSSSPRFTSLPLLRHVHALPSSSSCPPPSPSFPVLLHQPRHRFHPFCSFVLLVLHVVLYVLMFENIWMCNASLSSSPSLLSSSPFFRNSSYIPVSFPSTRFPVTASSPSSSSFSHRVSKLRGPSEGMMQGVKSPPFPSSYTSATEEPKASLHRVSLTGHPVNKMSSSSPPSSSPSSSSSLLLSPSLLRRNSQSGGNNGRRQREQDSSGRNPCRCGHSSSSGFLLSSGDKTSPSSSLSQSPSPSPSSPPSETESVAGRVVGGRESDAGSFPWIVGLLDSFGFNFCGGALIKSNYILTAAHCLYNKRVEELTAVVGHNDLDVAFLFNRVYRLRQATLHPGFVHSNWSHDIALIKVSSPILHLEPICLPDRSQRHFESLIVAGWGRTSSSSSSLHSLNSLKPSKLHQVSLPQVDQYFCEKTWIENYVASDQMCAGSAGRDTCIYDSGSPLMSLSGYGYDRSASLAGVTSFGSKRCGDPEKPGVYTRVASYLDWIHANTRDSFC